ncbi:MAG: oxidoreductase [Bacillota bacterium]
MSNKSALVLGSSGLVGSELLKYLLKDPEYSRVVAPVRKRLPFEHPKLEQLVIDFEDLENYQEYFILDQVFCCLGTTMKKAGTKEAFVKVDLEYPFRSAKMAKKSGVKKFLIISALGANEKSLVFYNHVKGQVENGIKKLGLDSLDIFRPSLLLGDRTEFRPAEKAAAILLKLIPLSFIGPLKRYRPVEAKAVAFAMYSAALKGTVGISIYESDKISEIYSNRENQPGA